LIAFLFCFFVVECSEIFILNHEFQCAHDVTKKGLNILIQEKEKLNPNKKSDEEMLEIFDSLIVNFNFHLEMSKKMLEDPKYRMKK
jgi:hypothetical protein